MNDEYELDPFDQEIRESLDLAENDEEIRQIVEAMGQEAKEDVELLIWEDDIARLLETMQFKMIVDLEQEPRDRLMRIRNYYHPQSITYDDMGNEIDIDPFPHYYCDSEDEDQELFDLGYRLGITGELGVYYEFLPIMEFSRGWWLGSFRRGMEEKNDKVIDSIREEIAVYDPAIVDEELSKVLSSTYVPPADDIRVIK